jgi:hypothetical protein
MGNVRLHPPRKHEREKNPTRPGKLGRAFQLAGSIWWCLGRDWWNDSAVVGDEARVVRAFCVWLAEHGWYTRLEVEHVEIVADRGNQRLYAQAKGRTAAIGLDVDTLYGQLSGECRRIKLVRQLVVRGFPPRLRAHSDAQAARLIENKLGH